jgi:U3 small nucleolar RNA-associated protein 21
MALLYLPYREVGVITNDIPVCISRLGNENFLTVSIGKSFQVMKVDKLSTCLISKPCDSDITHIATKTNLTFVATEKNKIMKYKRADIVCELGGHDATVSSLLCVGDILLSADVAGNIQLFDTKQNVNLHSLKSLNGGNLQVAAHPPTYLNKFLFGFSNGHLELWNVRTGKHLYSFQSHLSCLTDEERKNSSDRGITCISASPAVDVMAVGLQNGHIFLINLKLDTVLFHFKQVGSVADISFRTDAAADKNPYLVSASSHGHLYTWQIGGQSINSSLSSRSSKLVHTLKRAHDGRILTAQFLYGEPLLVTAGSDNCVSVWIFDNNGNGDTNGKFGPRLLRQRQGHTQQAAQVSFFGDASYDAQFGHAVSGSGLATGLLSCDGVGQLRFTRLDRYGLVDKFSTSNIENNELLRGRPLPPIIQYDSCFLGGAGHSWGDCVTVHRRSSFACLWRVQDRAATGKFLTVPQTHSSGQDVACSAVCMSVCGHFAVVGYENGWICRFNVQSGLFRGSYPKEQFARHVNLIEAQSQAAMHSKLTIGHSAPIVGVFIDATNTVLTSVSSDGLVCFWDFNTNSLLKTEFLPGSVTKLYGQRDSNFLAIVCRTSINTSSIRVYDISALRLMRVFVQQSDVSALCFSPDGRRLLSACSSRHLRVWDLATGRSVSWLRLKTCVNSICFSSSGDLVLARDREKGFLLAVDRSLTEFVAIDREPTQPIDIDLDLSTASLLLDDDTEEASSNSEQEKTKNALIESHDNQRSKEGSVELSTVPKAYWSKIFRFEALRNKKSIIAPVKKSSTPFFLQAPVSGLQPAISSSSDKDQSSKLLPFQSFSRYAGSLTVFCLY